MGKNLNIAILTPGVLPVPTVKGGAVEMLIEYILQYNENNDKHQITIFGIADEKITSELLSKYRHCNFKLLKQQSLLTRIKRFFYAKRNPRTYYHHYLDYFACQAFQQIKRGKFDLILIENRPNFVLYAADEIKDIPIILHLHNDTLDKNTPEAKKILEHATKVFTVSRYIKNRVDTIMTTNKVEVIYNGIDLAGFTRPDNNIYSRKDFNLKEDDFVAIFTGRLDPIKGIKELLEAFLLLKEYPNIKLLVAGGSNYGNSTENSFVQEMKDLVESLGDRVIFTGHLNYEAIPSILRLCNIGIIPSICEDALTLSSIEDMAVGLPLIVTRSGGIPEAVDERCAIIIEKDHTLVQKLEESIIRLYNNSELREKMGEFAIKRATLFSNDKYAHNMFEGLSSTVK